MVTPLRNRATRDLRLGGSSIRGWGGRQAGAARHPPAGRGGRLGRPALGLVCVAVLAVERVAEPAHPLAERAPRLGETLGPEDEERDHRHDDQLQRSDAGHAQNPRCAASAAFARATTASKKAFDWPSNRPELTRPVAAATAPAFSMLRGRMTEQSGRSGRRNVQGSGKIASERLRLFLRSGNRRPFARSPNRPSSDLWNAEKW